MKEVTFIRQNIEKWRSAELVVDAVGETEATQLADTYIDVISDLAFAQTHYPESKITRYLNNLASALHNEIYRSQRYRWSRLVTFWTDEVPRTMWEARRELLTSFIIFLASALVGMLSQLFDPEFCRIILGDNYVDMTLQNIANGEPMAVYNGDLESDMFSMITLNNVKVSFVTFVLGVFTSIGTGFILFQNGVMLGSFQTFFAQHGLLWQSALAVWLHGTLEISAIIVAGAAGIAMGNGWLFPGTYPRLVSFRRGARRGLRIVVGAVPLFVVAGFIEGFFTRHTEWPDLLRLGIILCSLAFVIYYYIVLPKKKNHELRETID
ncbi:MAG: stage II sporulation protein M [Prevotella sp.]|nr:stage II sporulation protein M [Prevotella sp.]